MPIDEDGNLVAPQAVLNGNDSATSTGNEASSNMAPPGYGQHVLDQLYDDADPSGIMTPNGVQSGLNSPFYAQSRAGSSENLASIAASTGITPAALSSRLQNVSMDPANRNISFNSIASISGRATPHHPVDGDHTADSSQPHSTELSRQTSEEDHTAANTGHSTPEHVDFPSMDQLSKVPSYTTATRAPLPRTPSYTGSMALPDYMTAMSAPSSPTRTPTNDPLSTISEVASIADTDTTVEESRSRSNSGIPRSNSALGFNFLHSHATAGDHHGERRLRLLQSRGS
jgi:arrestin-related trafficking adapter 4/5/7